MKKLALVLVFLMQPSLVMAFAKYDIKDGNSLLSHCNRFVRVLDSEGTEAQSALACVMYISGFRDGYNATIATAALKIYGVKQGPRKLNNVHTYCRPEKLPHGQFIRIVVRYLQQHPEQLHYSASLLILQALKEAFPCQ